MPTYLSEDELAAIVRRVDPELELHPELGMRVDAGFDAFHRELTVRSKPSQMRHKKKTGVRGRPKREAGDPPNRSPEDWLIQELATGVMDQRRKVPTVHIPLDDATPGGPTIDLLVGIVGALARKLEAGDIQIGNLQGMAAERLRKLTSPNALHNRLRKAGWSGAKRRLSRSRPLD